MPRTHISPAPEIETFGRYIRRLRETRNDRTGHGERGRMTQQQLADEVGVSKGYISQIESDRVPSRDAPPQVSNGVLRRLATALAVNEEEIFNRSWLAPAGFALSRTHGDTEVLDSGSRYQETEFRVDLGKALSERRNKLRLSRDELAEQSGVREYEIFQIENNHYDDLDFRMDSPETPFMVNLKAILKVLKMSMAEFARACAPSPAVFSEILRSEERIDRLVRAYSVAPDDLKRVFDTMVDVVLKE